MFAFNFIFFIPKRKVRIEFVPAGADFPRYGTRKEIDTYIEEFFNKGYGVSGEPLQRVPNYFWKAQYVPNEYHTKCYNFEFSQIPQSVWNDVAQTVAKKVNLDPAEIDPKSLLDRDLSFNIPLKLQMF